MFTFQDLIKYIGVAAIVFFLLKAFGYNCLSTNQIIILLVLIMLIVIFIASQKVDCPNKNKRERFQITPKPVVESVYPGPIGIPPDLESSSRFQTAGPKNTSDVLDSPDKYPNHDYSNDDINDMKDIVGINKRLYENLKEREQNAMDKITSKYQDEMVYTTTHPFNTVPLGTQLYGYTFLPPENWFRAYETPPVCITDKKSTVCPMTDSTIAGLLEFDSVGNTIGAQGINTKYIKKVLNKQSNK